MKKEIKDYLHLYLGCGVEIIIYEKHYHGIFRGSNSDYFFIKTDGDRHETAHRDYSKLKPILRPLSSMTEEEAKELAAVYTGYHITFVLIKDGQIIFNYYVGDEVQENVFDIEYSNAEGFLYLLSKGFDLFGLIDEGLAIDKTEVEKAKID